MSLAWSRGKTPVGQAHDGGLGRILQMLISYSYLANVVFSCAHTEFHLSWFNGP